MYISLSTRFRSFSCISQIGCQRSQNATLGPKDAHGIVLYHISNRGALIISIGFWGPLYYSESKEPPK